MYILLNFSRSIDGFDIYKNCFNPLFRDNQFDYINLSSYAQNKNMDFDLFKREIEGSLVKAATSKYSLIVLYDFEMQKNDPLVYSATAMINNLQTQVVDKIRHSYIIDNIYFITLDDVERNNDGQIIDTNLKSSIEFDRAGYLIESKAPHFLVEKDVISIENGFSSIMEKQRKSKDFEKGFADFDKQYLAVVENRILKALDNDIPVNDVWYENKIKQVFASYRKELKAFCKKLIDAEKDIEDLNFSITNFLEEYVTSYDNIQQNKLFRLNLLDKRGKYCRGELKFKNYYKIISLVIYLVTQDKKHIFGNAYNNKENHYMVDIDIEDDKIEKMLNSYYLNVKSELDELGKTKFAEIAVEDFVFSKIDCIVKNDKIYTFTKPKFSLLENITNLSHTKEFAENWKNRYIDYVSYSNQRLRKITDQLRTVMHRNFVTKKESVTLGDLYQLINEQESKVKELKDTIASNTPNDIIQVEHQIFEKNVESVKRANEILSKRISVFNFVFNIFIIVAISLIYIFLLRRFKNGALYFILKLIIILTPALVYIITQLIFCKLKVIKANKEMFAIEDYTREKMKEIETDDDQFVEYINEVYELMMRTKYIDRLKENANVASVDIDNYKYHKENMEKAISDVERLAKMINVRLKDEININEFNTIKLKVNQSDKENDLYCQLLYLDENPKKYILVNKSHKEDIDNELLNIVDKIECDYDEVYDGRN